MSRLFFSTETNFDLPYIDKEPIVIKAPPIIPVTIYQGIWRKLLPIMIGLLIIGLFLLFIFASLQTFSVQNLLYPFIILLLAIGIFQGSQGGSDTAEINQNRRLYLNYLSHIRDQVIEREQEQKKHLFLVFPQCT